MKEKPEELTRKNFVLGVLNGILFRFGISFTYPHTVLPVFVSLFTSSKVIIGSVGTLWPFGWSIPQIFVASLTEHWKRRKPIYIMAAVLRSSAWFFLFLLVYLYAGGKASFFLISFLILYGASCLAGGLGGLPFMDIVGKVIATTKRGRFFSLRLFFGGILSVGGGLVVKYILSNPEHFPFPHNYALLFFLTFFWTSLGVLLFVCVKEPTQAAAVERRSNFFLYLRKLLGILRENQNYKRFFWAVIFLNCGIITLPFYVIYGREVLRFPSAMVGIFISAQMIGAVISALFWGFLSDRYGNKLVVRLAGLLGALVPLLIILAAGLHRIANPGFLSGEIFHQLPLAVYIIAFIFIGMNLNGLFIGQTNLLLEIAPVKERATYIGITNTAIGLVTLLPLLGGYIIELTSYTVAFSLSLFLMLIGIFFAFLIVEPRTSKHKLR